MLAFAIFAVTIVIVLLVAVFYMYPGSRQRPTTIPGPDPSDPKEGNLPDVHLAGGLHNFLSDLHAQFGPVASYWHGSQLVASVAVPEGLSEQTHIFDRPPVLFEFLKPMVGENCIQFSNGAEARARRKLYDTAFSHEACEGYYLGLKKLTNEMCAKWASFPSDQHIPLHQYMIAYAIKAILITNYGSYFKDDAKILQLAHDYDVCMTELVARQTGPVPGENDPRDKRFQESLKRMRDITRKALEADAKSETTETNSFIDVLRSSDLSQDIKESDAIAYLIGGFHTTGNMLTWTFYYLSLYPETQEKLFEEIKCVLGPEPFEPHHMKKLRYLRQVLDETLRCGIVAPYAARVQMDSEYTLCGHTVPRGTPTIQALGVVFQSEEIWPKPERFDPERFTDAENAKRHPMAFQPFGFAGRRKCPGYRFAYLDASLVVTEVVRRFKLSLVEGQEVTPNFGFVARPEEEIWITLSPRPVPAA